MDKRKPRTSGWCEARLNERRRLSAAQNNPYYVARGNEGPLLETLISEMPPDGGLSAYIDDLNQKKKE